MEKTLTISIVNIDGRQVDTVEVDTALIGQHVNTGALYQEINSYLSHQRKGNASTKTMGEVSGGGKKPWKQKGTGRARVGSIRSPLWRHGGVVFGPHPRDFSFDIPEKIKTSAMRSALHAKIDENKLILIDGINSIGAKTKDASKFFLTVDPTLKNQRKPRQILVLLEKKEHAVRQSLRNLRYLSVEWAQDVTPYQILAHKKILATKEAWAQLVKRLKI